MKSCGRSSPARLRFARNSSARAAPSIWDDIFENIETGLLDEARDGRANVMVAAAVHTLSDRRERIVYESDEAGDGEGSAPMSHLVALSKTKLRPKESIRFEMVDAVMTHASWRCAVHTERANRQKRWGDIFTLRKVLARVERARRETSSDIHVSLAVLELPNGEQRIACADSERGDGEARHEMSNFIRRVKRTKRLRQGEHLERHLLKLTLSEDGWVASSVRDASLSDRKKPSLRRA